MVRALVYTFQAQDALCCVKTAAGIVGDVHIHGTDFFASAAGDAPICVVLHPH